MMMMIGVEAGVSGVVSCADAPHTTRVNRHIATNKSIRKIG
jgi:hypothetical protein